MITKRVPLSALSEHPCSEILRTFYGGRMGMADNPRLGAPGLLMISLLALALGACGARQAPASTASSEPAPVASSHAPEPAQAPAAEGKASSSDKALSRDIPRDCSGDADVCVPPKAFAEQLCRGKFPEL